MRNSRNRKNWLTVFISISLVLLPVWSSPLRQSAVALYDIQHPIDVFLRFHFEVLEKTPAGIYYSGLMMEHNYEQYEIIQAHPDHFDEFWHVVELYTPGIEALTEGKGDTVLITEEHIKSLKEEWEWEAQFESTAMREDIEKELQRFPLETFVGMTFIEAWEYVNANFPPELALPTPTPFVTPTPWCVVGTGSNCMATPATANHVDSNWAYYARRGMYFEYSKNWQVVQERYHEDHEEFLLVPALNSPESSFMYPITVRYGLSPYPPGYPLFDPLEYPFVVMKRPEPIWKQLVSLDDFEGCEFLYIPFPGSQNVFLEAIIYDPKTQMYFEMYATISLADADDSIYDPQEIKFIFSNFQHILETLRYQMP